MKGVKMQFYQVDAFTDVLFRGNPAAVCPLKDQWLPDKMMQDIAFENNLSETAFFIPVENGYAIRWFTPKVEVDLCGHATLASAHVLFHHLGYSRDVVAFQSKSGLLTVTRQGDLLAMNFPKDTLTSLPLSDDITACFSVRPLKALRGKTDYLIVFESEKDVRDLQPNLERLAQLPARGVMVTARGDHVDFVSRFFAPKVGVNEDPVTGSAHTSLVPYWAGVLHKTSFHALQVSARGGELFCRDLGDRVEIAGKAKTYLVGEILLS